MNLIRIIGIGWSEDDLTLRAVKLLKSGEKIVLRTGRCGCAEWLKQENIPFETMDSLFEKSEDFDELIDLTAQAIYDLAQNQPIHYCVNDLTDRTCGKLIELTDGQVELIPGVSEGSALTAFSGDGVTVISASDADEFRPNVRISTLVREIDSPMLAGEIKLRLMEAYPEELMIYVSAAEGKIATIPLCELDWMDEATYDHRMCALIPSVRSLDQLSRFDLQHLEEIMRRLRGWDGCPWDREQTHETLRKYLIEEAYEAVDAINRDNTDDLYDELGDVLLQIVFHSDIAKQYGEFELSDVTTAICQKMMRRHKHIFGDAHADTPEDVSILWEQVKKQEKSLKTGADVLRSVTNSLPAMMRAEKVLKKAMDRGAQAGDIEEMWKTYRAQADSRSLGDFLLALAAQTGSSGLNMELALCEASDRFIDRFADQEASQGDHSKE